jgi:type IV pilus assembly protein PilP
MNRRTLAFTLFLPLLLSGCIGDDYADIKQFMEEVKARPKKKIEPIPIYPPYKSYTYSVMASRSPFAKPMAIQEISRLVGPVSSVKPNDDRTREYLESFSVEALSMVGHIQKGDVMYALVNDGQGSVHPVSRDNYLGRNHGKIVGLTATEIKLIEIVPGGGDTWVERPRTISLQE